MSAFRSGFCPTVRSPVTAGRRHTADDRPGGRRSRHGAHGACAHIMCVDPTREPSRRGAVARIRNRRRTAGVQRTEIYADQTGVRHPQLRDHRQEAVPEPPRVHPAAAGGGGGRGRPGVLAARARRSTRRPPAPHGRKLENVKKSPLSLTDEKLNTWDQITTYNNYYEFGTDKDSPSLLRARRSRPSRGRSSSKASAPRRRPTSSRTS